MENRYMTLDKNGNVVCIICYVREHLGDELGSNIEGSEGVKCTICGYENKPQKGTVY